MNTKSVASIGLAKEYIAYRRDRQSNGMKPMRISKYAIESGIVKGSLLGYAIVVVEAGREQEVYNGRNAQRVAEDIKGSRGTRAKNKCIKRCITDTEETSNTHIPHSLKLHVSTFISVCNNLLKTVSKALRSS